MRHSDDQRILAGPEVATLDRPLALIEDAALVPHFLGSLWDHLCGTWKILNRHAYGQNICLAGLLHSIYSTEHYCHSLCSLSNRRRVATCVGGDVEQLVYHYCATYKKSIWSEILGNRQSLVLRSRLDDQPISLTRDEALCILQVACADWIEQCAESNGSPKAFMAWYFKNVAFGYINFDVKLSAESKNIEFTEEKENMSILAYHTFLTDENPIESEACKEAALLNPFSAELRIFLAIQQCYYLDSNGAQLNFSRARRLISAWGTAWDKRLTSLEWEMALSWVEIRIKPENAPFLLDQVIGSINEGRLPEFIVGRGPTCDL
ncbi:hypothetical protein B0G75_13928 [Paraburkholderia sp. BL18I3N2]|uniref:DUF6817 domain-containing protein n=1 Tax=Paraburkholderia sp. BL18I3N2 TaxID=1938799 RepID=UPI000D466B74|nr:hypothetical protein [Paraburkholderia sp. BL18I3N2]PRX19165.1 hypothetical protein B0G75_13928 [Paraburkholderia sp. BL18I3N2]